MRAEPTTVVNATTFANGRVYITSSSTLDESGAQTEVRFMPPDEEPTVMYVRGNLQTVWMQLQNWLEPRTGCWLDIGLTQSPVGLQALAGPEPAYVSILGVLSARGFVVGSQTSMIASVPVRYAGALFTAQVFEEFDLDSASEDAQVDVLIEVGTRVNFLQLRGTDYLEAVQAAGGSATPQGEQIAAIDLSVRYPEPPPYVEPVEAPAPELVFGPAQAGC